MEEILTVKVFQKKIYGNLHINLWKNQDISETIQKKIIGGISNNISEAIFLPMKEFMKTFLVELL